MIRADEIRIGDQIPNFTRTTGLEHWNRFAAVNDEFVPFHMDDSAGRAAGYPSSFGMGNLQWAYMHNALRAWLGSSGEIRSLSCQFRSPNLKDGDVVVTGQVTGIDREDSEILVSLDLQTADGSGKVMAPAKAVVVLFEEN